ncbi:MAG: multidrug ABC transporter permease [Bacillaceae bacterium]|uniref:ABC transporter ATP-binding protein n=1 Tax=Aeribacillus composti TaxID=1868734 RepID=A0ABY9WNH4_9BACI|nr:MULTISPECIES: ABC transporter ATP-binding protein [Aeribacillus]MED0701362.1 ABC transporter ATP-binding protein [Aeribacillus composti]REJ20978.1 MAG: multidrug ABC transporter permease [Bacillaceae bacterium]RZI52433.1 ABC transporter ATP-binding protein [Aeribacillus pallidus]WNF34846.1 ABC transporter ATP-binding protein [Aeribacillus composti]
MANPPFWIFVAAIVLSLLEAATGLVVPIFTRDLIDRFSTSSIETHLIFLLIAVFILQSTTSGFSYYLMSYIGEYIVAKIRSKLWNHVLYLPIPYFDRHESGELMSRITQDTYTVKSLVTEHLANFVSGIVTVLGAVAILIIIDWKMTLILFIFVPLAIVLVLPLGQKIYKISMQTQDEMATFSGNLGRVLSDIRLVKSNIAEPVEKQNGNQKIQQLFRFGLKEAKIQAIISPLMTTIIMAVLVVIIGYGGIRVARGELSAGSLVAIIIYMVQIIVPFSQMAGFFTAFQKAMGATERIQQLLNTETEHNNGNTRIDVHKPIVFQNISFAYEKGKTILQNVHFEVKPGQTVAIVGPSGAGKTTIFSLIERFYQPTNGAIKLGNTDIREFPLFEWRQQIGYVSQESPIMSGTIRENICYGLNRTVSEEEVRKAAQLANVDEFIEQMQDGYETEVGERGIKLSGGQRQRIAIARALLRNPKILLLDEATSNLDSNSEQKVQNALLHLMKNRTTFVIAHRLSTIINADLIIVLENGKITGQGTHNELLQSHPLYQKLVSRQMQNFAPAND